MNVDDLLERFLAVHTSECARLGKREKWQLQQRWREHFTAGVKDATGKWILGDADWHAFSSGYAPSVQGFGAEVAYGECKGESFILISSNEQVPAFRCIAQSLPAFTDLYAFAQENPQVFDLYLFSPDFRWTLVLTHEPDYGPYFARSSRTDETESRYQHG